MPHTDLQLMRNRGVVKPRMLHTIAFHMQNISWTATQIEKPQTHWFPSEIGGDCMIIDLQWRCWCGWNQNTQYQSPADVLCFQRFHTISFYLFILDRSACVWRIFMNTFFLSKLLEVKQNLCFYSWFFVQMLIEHCSKTRKMLWMRLSWMLSPI